MSASAIFFILHKCGSAVTGFKCFLVIFVWSIRFVDLNCVSFCHQTISKCLYGTNFKQTDSIVLATSGNLKCYTHDQQCDIIICTAVLHGNNSTLICLIFAHASA